MKLLSNTISPIHLVWFSFDGAGRKVFAELKRPIGKAHDSRVWTVKGVIHNWMSYGHAIG